MKRKFFVTILSLILVVTMMPLSVFANTNSDNEEPEYGTHEYWEQKYPGHEHVESIKPGQVFETGTYFFDKDFSIIDSKEGQSGIIIKGDVTFIIENGSTLSVKGGATMPSEREKYTMDVKSSKGSGAGIELTEGNNLWIKGTGKVIAQAGDVNGFELQNGRNADPGESTNTSGDGGNGTGGMGAAIGSKGGEGGMGGEGESASRGSFFTDQDGKDGHKGTDGKRSQNVGGLKISGNIDLEIEHANINVNPVGGKYGHKRTYYFKNIGTNAGGGAGGTGFYGAGIGSGGSGGAGGGAGGAGGEVLNGWPNGGGGGAGGGLSKLSPGGSARIDRNDGFDYHSANGEGSCGVSGGKGGCGSHGGDNPGGNGGNGGDSAEAGSAGMIYATTLESRDEQCKGIGYGKDAAIKQVYPASECEIMIKDYRVCVVHIPTGTVLEKDKDYTLETIRHYDRLDVIAHSGKIVNNTMEGEGGLRNEFEATTYTVNHYLQNLSSDGKTIAESYECVDHESFDGIINTKTEAVAKDYEGFTAQEISQKVVKEDGTTEVDIYYDRNEYELTLRSGARSAYTKPEYKTKVYYGASIEKNLPEGYELAEPGWHFDRWSPSITSDTVMPAKNTMYRAMWASNPIKEYTVKKFAEKISSDGQPSGIYEEIGKPQVKTGRVGGETNVKAEYKEGFTAQPIEQQTIKEDGSTVVKICYNRNVHKVTFDMGEHSALVKPVIEMQLCYGAQISDFLPEGYDLAEEGYKFAGWNQDLKEDTTMGNQDVEFTAKWIKLAPATFTEKIYVQDLSSDEKEAASTYSLLSEEIKDGYIGEMTDVHPEVEGFHAKPVEQKVIQEDGKTVVEVYMDRDAYDINVTFTRGSVICKQLGVDYTTIPVKVYYGATIGKSLPENYYRAISGYRFVGFAPTLNPSEKASPETITGKDYLAIFSGAF